MPYKDLKKKKEYDRKYHEKNREKINARVRVWSKNEKAKEKRKEYREKNRDSLLKYWVEYRKRPGQKEKFNNYYKNWINKKLKEDPHFKLKQNLSHRIYMALKTKKISKSKKTRELIGCTVSQLWQHLEKQFQPGMTKENYGKWHVDHIKPCASFDLTREEDQAICFHYTNLQPLWALDNIKKGKNEQKQEQDRNQLPDSSHEGRETRSEGRDKVENIDLFKE